MSLQHCSSLYRNTEQSFLCYYSTGPHYTETQNSFFFVAITLFFIVNKTHSSLFIVTTALFCIVNNRKQSFLCYYNTDPHYTEKQNSLFFVTTVLFLIVKKHRTIFFCSYSTDPHYTERQNSLFLVTLLLQHWFFTIQKQNNLFFVTTTLFLIVKKHRIVFSLTIQPCSTLYRNTQHLSIWGRTPGLPETACRQRCLFVGC